HHSQEHEERPSAERHFPVYERDAATRRILDSPLREHPANDCGTEKPSSDWKERSACRVPCEARHRCVSFEVHERKSITASCHLCHVTQRIVPRRTAIRS